MQSEVLAPASSWRLRDYFVLLRPKGFAPAMLLVTTGWAIARPHGGTLSLVGDLALLVAAYVIGISGGSLLLNSAIDRDTGPVNFLDRPPAPPPALAAVGIVVMIAGALLFATRGPLAGALAATLVIASIGYSHGFGMRRWKEIPGVDLALNGLGYGLGTIVLGHAITGAPRTPELWLAGLGFTLSMCGTLPASQIFQLRPRDTVRDARNFAALLGPRRALWFAAAMFTLALPLLLATPIQRALTTGPLPTDVLYLPFAALFLTSIIHVLRWSHDPMLDSVWKLKRLYLLILTARLLWILGTGSGVINN